HQHSTALVSGLSPPGPQVLEFPAPPDEQCARWLFARSARAERDFTPADAREILGERRRRRIAFERVVHDQVADDSRQWYRSDAATQQALLYDPPDRVQIGPRVHQVRRAELLGCGKPSGAGFVDDAQ